jgi:hypothetical protein
MFGGRMPGAQKIIRSHHLEFIQKKIEEKSGNILNKGLRDELTLVFPELASVSQSTVNRAIRVGLGYVKKKPEPANRLKFTVKNTKLRFAFASNMINTFMKQELIVCIDEVPQLIYNLSLETSEATGTPTRTSYQKRVRPENQGELGFKRKSHSDIGSLPERTYWLCNN